ncbi:hypothetical protein LDENG_00277090 [Lucifuga dentata]|nr:hypothetical protein LDENG_00277090 [Lucifuga dentata]
MVQQRLKAAGLQLNEKKCHFRQASLKFLGHLVTANGTQPDTAFASYYTGPCSQRCFQPPLVSRYALLVRKIHTELCYSSGAAPCLPMSRCHI